MRRGLLYGGGEAHPQAAFTAVSHDVSSQQRMHTAASIAKRTTSELSLVVASHLQYQHLSFLQLFEATRVSFFLILSNERMLGITTVTDRIFSDVFRVVQTVH